MSRFAQLFSGSVAAIHEHQFATAVSVTELGVTTPTPAVLHRIQASTRVVGGDTRQVLTRRVRFTELASLREDSSVTIDGQAWQIESIDPAIASGIEVVLVRTLITEQARSGYRK